MGHDHHHHHHQTERGLIVSIVLNSLITIFQIVGGFFSGSLALLSDALHNFSDVVSLVLSYIASKLVKRKASYNSTFGYKRAEIIAAFINSASLIVMAVFLSIEALERINAPKEINAPVVIVLSVIGILINGYSAVLLRHQSKENLNIKAAYLHLLSDMLASIAVLASGVIMYAFQIYWIDYMLSFILSIYLIIIGYKVLIKATKMLMLFTPDHIDIQKLIQDVHQFEAIKRLHHIHLWSLNDHELHLEAHIDCYDNLTLIEFNKVLLEVENLLKNKYGINHITLQPEYQKQDAKDYIVQD